MSELSDLTIVIPTYNRKAYLERSISYWKDQNKDINILIIDGSENEMNIQPLIENHKNFRYYHQPVSFFKRLNNAISLVKTKYVSLLSDDEFFIASAMRSCIQELENDSSLVSCNGQCIGFNYKENQLAAIRMYPLLKNYSLLDDSPIKRMVTHMNPYVPSSLYSIMRTDAWKTVIQIMSSRVFDVYAISELQFEMAAAYTGKSKAIHEVMWLRSLENVPIRNEKGLDVTKKFDRWWKNKNKIKEHREFLDFMVNHLYEINEIPKPEIEEGLVSAIENKVKNDTLGLTKIKNVLVRKFKERQKTNITTLSKKLEKEGTKVDQDAFKHIEKLVKNFHLQKHLA